MEIKKLIFRQKTKIERFLYSYMYV